MSAEFSHGYALLIGVGQTAKPEWSLPVTVNDAQAIYQILTDPDLCGYPADNQHVRLLQDVGASREAILKNLAWLEASTQNDAEATVVIYYSGHGWLDRSNDSYYLIPHDTKLSDIPRSSLSAHIFSEALSRIMAQRLLVILDCCHAEGMAQTKGELVSHTPLGFTSAPVPKQLISTLKQGTGRAIFTSCRGGQKSWVRTDQTLSLYTYHLLEALQGAGNKPGDTKVHLSNIMNHLGKAVPASAKKMKAEQTPFFQTATEDYPVAMLRGGEGLPDDGWKGVRREARQTIVQTVNRIEQGGTVLGMKTDEDISGVTVRQSVNEVAGNLTGIEIKKPNSSH